jgi:hypothetical protein
VEWSREIRLGFAVTMTISRLRLIASVCERARAKPALAASNL